jgi:predicted TPR repeat methyltransferase
MLSQIKSLLQSKAAQALACRKDGDAHLKADRMDEAEKAYQRALAIDGQNVEACVGLAYVFNQRKDHASAKEALSKALSADPSNADAHFMLGTIAREEGDIEAAARHFDRAIECRPDFAYAYRHLFELLAQSGQGERACEVLEKAAAACPEVADVQNMRGRVLAAQRDYAGAIASFRKAASLAPGIAEYHKNLARVLAKTGAAEQATESYRKAIWFDPDFVEGHHALADEMRRMERHGEAASLYREVLRLNPQSANATVNLGVTLQAQGKIDDAIECYRRAAEIDPQMAVAHANLGSLMMVRGANEEAIACFEKVLEIDPNHAAAHVLAGLKGGKAERAPSAYVAKLFDWYASSFDTHLVEGLRYTVPEKLADVLRQHAGAGDEKWDVLDLGCGTGLAGVAVAPFSRSIVGVDLSSKMLDKARERNLYERLEQLDLIEMMRAEAPLSYDLVIAADVFVYLGKLDELALEAHRLLRPGMYFAFSVESLDALAEEGADGDYRLNDTGRFAHSKEYLARLCAQSGFENLSTTETHSRVNQGKPVHGYLVLWKKSLADASATN